LLVTVASFGVTACGSDPTFTPEQASEIILAQFPDSDLQIRNVRIDEEDRGVAFARFNDENWIFYFQPAEESWLLDAVETDGSFYYLKDLEQISETIALMSDVAGALERYRVGNGTYPIGEDASVLATMAPEFIGEEVTFADAWDGPLAYESDGDSYTMISNGADKTGGTRDDVILHDGNFVGAGSGRNQ